MKPPHIILTVLATVVIFASGVVTGGLLVRKTTPPQPPPQPGWPMARFDQFQRAVNTLELDPEQRKKINDLIRKRQAYVAEMVRLIEPDLPGLFVELRRDINQVLTPAQEQELNTLWNRIQQRRQMNRGGEFPGRPADNSGVEGRRPPPRPFGPRPQGP